MSSFSFEVVARQGFARAGVLHTPHSDIRTPVFMPVGTKASVKALDSHDLESLGAEIILGNTYHLYLRPGDNLVAEQGGLHGFMKWERPILTDSGGYQVSSLGLFKKEGEEKLSKITDEGVRFFSHIDGSKHFFTPEKAIQIQAHLGADIIMAFDEATPEASRAYAREAMERTHRWLEQSVQEWKRQQERRKALSLHEQALFGIVQGGNFENLRRISAEVVLEHDLPGVALGGATIGQSAEQTELNVSWVRDLLPQDKPLYLMGVGVGLGDVVEAIKSGADMFDCVAPTKLARSGLLYIGQLIPGSSASRLADAKVESEFENNRISLNQERFKNDSLPIDPACDCMTCTTGYSRAYLRHLMRARELAYYRLASIHNLRKMIVIAAAMRELVLEHD